MSTNNNEQVDMNFPEVSSSKFRNCTGCMFSNKMATGPYECRRWPPSVNVFPAQNKLGVAQLVANTSFPQVDQTFWCGEFATKI